jgi:hypothetical protein
MNFVSFAFVDPTMFFSTMTLKYGRHFADNDQAQSAAVRQIVLRGPADLDFTADSEQVDFPLLGEWPSARNVLDDIYKQIAGHIGMKPEVGQVIVQSLAGDAHIPWRTDNTPYAQRYNRFKLLVSPCTGGCWYSGAEALAPVMGNLTYVNHRILNSAVNLGPVPQISLIVDARSPTLQ